MGLGLRQRHVGRQGLGLSEVGGVRRRQQFPPSAIDVHEEVAAPRQGVVHLGLAMDDEVDRGAQPLAR
ncbi:hypothetical protein D3C87_1679500 [compost metagenome]